MRVLMLTPSYDPIIGGTETVVENLAINLNRINVETDVMTFNMDKKWEPKWKLEMKKDRFSVYRIPALNPIKQSHLIGDFSKVHVFPSLRFTEILKNYDLLHFHDDFDLTFPLFSSSIRKRKVFQCHTLIDTHPDYEKNPICRYFLTKSSDIYLAVSTNEARLLRELGADNIEILPNGVDINKFTFISKDRQENLVLCIGRFDRRKGIHVLLSSLAFLRTPVNLVLVGPHYHDDYSKEILLQVKSINEEGKHSIAYAGSLDRYDLIKWYQTASILVCPSLTESFGIVNIEAMSCGTPVIASDIEGIRDIIESGKDGILVPPNDSIRLANALQYLLDNEDVRIGLGKEGRKKAEKKFSWNTIVDKLYDIYKMLK